MKTIGQMMRVESSDDLPDIYCDMDQVLCNFMKGAEEAIGGDFVTANKDERRNKINQTKGFWANLEWMPGGKRLYVFISRYNTHILSAYSARDPNSKNGKMTWLARHTGIPKRNINLVKRADKKLYAVTDGKPNILIDDYIKNINEWQANGGIGVHHTDARKSIGELKRLGFK